MAANARGSATHTATRHRAYQDGASRPEWQCQPHGTARSGPSGSAAHARLRAQGRVAARPHTATRHRAYRNGTSRPEWQCPPHGTARSGPSGSADHTATRRRTYRQHALTLPLDVERTGSTPSHCHSTSSVPKMSRCLPVISRTRKRWSSRA